jgi:hypothetical protein
VVIQVVGIPEVCPVAVFRSGDQESVLFGLGEFLGKVVSGDTPWSCQEVTPGGGGETGEAAAGR